MSPTELAAAIAQHYAAVRRDLPWRRSRDPYAIWVSEIMLQQTRVLTVIPYWQRWMATFPTVRALADAPLDAVLAAWAGLGYYSRARNLQKGAQAIATRFAGTLPSRASELRGVPGIGPYTAGAIASIAFGERTPLVDGNVARVLSRVYAIASDIKSSQGQRELWARAGQLVDALPASLAPGDLNQGLMELGQALCSPTQPRCLVCPIAAGCAANRRGEQTKYPVIAPRKRKHELPVLERCALWLQTGPRASQIVLARRVPEGLFGGLWELPQAGSISEIAGALGVTADGPAVAHHDQTLSHRRLRISVFASAPPRSLEGIEIPGYDAVARVSLTAAHALGVAASTKAILTKYEATPWTSSSTPTCSRSSRAVTNKSSKASIASATPPRTKTSARPPRAPRKASTSSSTIRSK
ncbi:MAG TPA: A/G-specific adenine glycosylase [Kofleriaceae bacterium]|nr:A/G-specific adenine glycosylase [Kofleriaceae bacterium]